jgi:tetratricopeptide (TPR) repeat protein
LLVDHPNNVVKLSDRASTFALAGGDRNAEADFEAALRVSEKHPWPLARRAHNLYASRGEHDRAIADCERILGIDPNFVEAYFYRGLARLAKSEDALAVQDLDRVLALNQPDAITFQGRMALRYPELYQARAEALARLRGKHGADAGGCTAKGAQPTDAAKPKASLPER